MGRTWVLAWACLAVVLAGCATPGGEDESAVASQPAMTAETPVDAEAEPGIVRKDAQPDSSMPGQDAAPAGPRPGPPLPGQQIPELAIPGPIPVDQPISGQPILASQRHVIRDATIELRVDDVADATERVRLVAPSHGGFVASEESAAATATLTLRVASEELDAALAALAELGEVTSRRLSTQDVTEQVIDLEARINSQRASVERIRALLDRATTIGEVVQVESELTWRQAELESLQQRAAALADQVALSTVRVRLEGPETEPAAAGGGFGSGLAAGWDALLTAGRVALKVLGAVLPFVVVLAIPAGAVLLWYRRRRRAAASS